MYVYTYTYIALYIHVYIYSSIYIYIYIYTPYSAKFWWGKTLVDLANGTPFTNILPSQIPDSLK